MAQPFSQTLRALDADGRRQGMIVVLSVVALLGVWLVWFVAATVTIWLATDDAALEIDLLPHRVEAPVDAEVSEAALQMSAVVEAGDVLVRLRTTEFETSLRRAEARREAVQTELDALGHELAVRRQILGQLRAGSVPRLDEAMAELDSARAAARTAEEDAERQAKLFEQGQVSESEARRQRSEAHQKERSVEALRQRVEVLRSDARLDQEEQNALVAELLREKASLQGMLTEIAGDVATLRDEIELRTIRAPVSGRLAEVSRLAPGSVVEAGDGLCTVVPVGKLRVRAEFAVAEALGRIRPGQIAIVRLDGFPWAQFGTLTATVERVAGEAKDGRLEVLLELDETPIEGVDLVHGMTGRVEISVEELSPAALVVRASGQRLTGN